MKYLLDTNVISELVARQPNRQVIEWIHRIDSLEPENLYLSVITIGELRKGIEKLPDSPRKDTLLAWLMDDLLVRFDGRVLSVDVEVMLAWGELTGRSERKGRKLPAIDSLIAALAIRRECILVTRNESDFVDTGAKVINPWQPNESAE
jgi:predicted nucleic acid-binding protein